MSVVVEMFKREADFEICGEPENGRDAIEKAQQLRPDLIVMDLSMPVMNGLGRVSKRTSSSLPWRSYWTARWRKNSSLLATTSPPSRLGRH
jgi:CheY-like chemotaxis protein